MHYEIKVPDQDAVYITWPSQGSNMNTLSGVQRTNH